MFIRKAADDFSTLSESLRLRSSFDSAAPLISQHLERVQELLNDFIRTDPFVDQSMASALTELSEESIWRLITSPYLCELLMIAPRVEPIRWQILQALVAEIKIVSPKFKHPLRPRWTIDGDIVLDSRIAENFPALRTSCGIKLNYQSSIHNTGKPGIGGYTYEVAVHHLERIETGLGIIAKVSSPARSMVHLFTTTIQVRQNLNRPNVVNSSTHTSIGLIRSDNFHHLHTDLPEVVDMLVHESIHQYLHLFEEQLFPFVENVPKTLLDVRLFPSPWSGNLLDLRSYTHAILVWYGLWNFWGHFVTSGFSHPELSQTQALEKREEAAFGFTNSRSVMDNLGEARAYLSTEYVRHVDRLQEQLNQRHIRAV